MKILIVNDDGIQASQMLPLARWAKKLGDVTVVAPKVEQSGKSQGIELHEAFEVKPFDIGEGIEAYSVDSTPADCVRYAVLGMKRSFDLVISGINRGFNMGTDIMYSGTAGAVFESVSLGMRAVAISTCPEYYEKAAAHLDDVFDFILGQNLLAECDAWNVNIPPQGKQFRITRQGGHYYSDDFPFVAENMVKAQGKCVYEDSGNPELDTDSVNHGYISVSPITICRTNMDVFRKLQHLNP